MKKQKEQTYRGIFAQTNGVEVGLDFYAENRTLAQMHAIQVAGHDAMHVEQGPLRLVSVRRVDASEFRAGDAGSWFPVEGDQQ